MGVWCVVVGRRRRRTLRPQPPPPSIAPIISRHVSCTSESTRRLGVSTSCLSLSVPCLAFCARCRLPRLCCSAWVPPAALSCSTRPILLLLSVCASCLRLCHLRPSPSLPSCVPPPLPAVVFPRRDLVPGRVTHVCFVLTVACGCRLSAILVSVKDVACDCDWGRGVCVCLRCGGWWWCRVRRGRVWWRWRPLPHSVNGSVVCRRHDARIVEVFV